MNTSNNTGMQRHSILNLIFSNAFLIALILSSATQAHADGARERNSGSEWRLGSHNQIFLRTSRGWQRVRGSAIDVADGWVIGTDRRSGGYGIYRWNGRKFDRMPGGAVEIGGSYEHPWVINNRGERFEWAGRDWREVRAHVSQRDTKRDERHYGRNDDEHNNRRDGNSDAQREDRRRPSW